MSELPSREIFRNMYASQPPWDIGKPQKPFLDAADQITGTVLDAGCGTGENALYFAGHGRKVTGIDFLEEPIDRAKRKASERGITATFLVKDALTLADWDERFDSVIDSGLFHVFPDDQRKRYVEGLANVVKPGGRLFLACFRDDEPGTQGPRRVSRKELFDAFASGWAVESIQPLQFEVLPACRDMFTEGGPKAWFAVIRRGSPPPAVEGVVETAVYGDDLEALEDFYCQVLGLTVLGKESNRHVFFQAGPSNVLLAFKPETTLKGDILPAHGSRGPGHFALGTDPASLEAWRRQLASKGVAIEKEVTWPRGGHSLYFRDPAGNSVELVTRGVWGIPAGW